MKKILPVLMLFFTISSISQKNDTAYHKVDLEKLQKQIDSSTKMMDTMFDHQYKQLQEQEMQRTMEQNNRNLDALMQMQRAREAQQKKAMWMRLGLGIFFLGVLIFGLMRRRKKNAA